MATILSGCLSLSMVSDGYGVFLLVVSCFVSLIRNSFVMEIFPHS